MLQNYLKMTSNGLSNETRASGVIFHPEGDDISSNVDNFEVDGTTVSFTVK